MPVMIIVLLIVGALLLFSRRKKPEPTYHPPVIPEEYLTEQKEKSKPVPPKDEAVRVYLYGEQPGGWCCPNCECENDSEEDSCCVCGWERE